jgi:hypothetical protein
MLRGSIYLFNRTPVELLHRVSSLDSGGRSRFRGNRLYYCQNQNAGEYAERDEAFHAKQVTPLEMEFTN